MNVMRRENPGIPDSYYVTSFVAGLNSYIKSHVECFKPKDMQTAIRYARRMEKAQPPVVAGHTKAYVPQPRRQVTFDQPKVEAKDAMQNRNTVIQQAKQNQVCYKCREPWVPGHRQVCRMSQKAQIQALQALEEGMPETIFVTDFADPDLENIDQLPEEAILQVSMHAAMGIGAVRNTFILTVKVGNISATALVDSGSTTFVSPEMAAKLKVQLRPTNKIKVAVASGEVLWSEFILPNCSYEIQNQKFSDSFRVLQLKGYDMILGVDWLKKYSPIHMDFIKMEMKVSMGQDHIITFQDETVPSYQPEETKDKVQTLMDQAVCGFVLFTACAVDTAEVAKELPVELQELLQDYELLFQEPTDLHCARA